MIMWVAIFLFTVSLNAQIDKTFSSEKECWNYYNKKSHGLVWLTCEKASNMRGNSISKFPLNIVLPTPIEK
jgi:hypothetical protein